MALKKRACFPGWWWTVGTLAVCAVGPAGAAVTTWVAAGGTDSGFCTVSAPCASLQYAVDRTSLGGTVYVAGSGSYGLVRITRPLSIVAPAGVAATVTTMQGVGRSAIDIDPGTGGVVLLRGLTVKANVAQGYFGDVQIDSGRVSIEDCVLLSGNSGIYITGGDYVLVRGSRIEATQRGIFNKGGVGAVYLERDVVTLNDYGLVGVFNSYGDNVVSGNVTCDVCDATVTGVGLE